MLLSTLSKPVVFVSYSHKDEEQKEQLVSHLKVLQSAGLIELWVDDRIEGGADWEAEIKQAMAHANVAILLVSANFLTSDFILGKEIPGFLERRKNEGLTVFPIIAKPCAWRVFDWLAKMNVRPKNGRPIWQGDNAQVDADLAVIVDEVVAIIQKAKNRLNPTDTGPSRQSSTPASVTTTARSNASPVIQPPYDLKNIRKLLAAAYNLEELRQLCYEGSEFRPVYDNFSEARKDALIRHLIEHCERKGLLNALLAVVREDVPEKYAEYQGKLGANAVLEISGGEDAISAPELASAFEVENRPRLIKEKKRRLYELELRQARAGFSTPPEISMEIEDLKAEIAKLEQNL